MIPALRRAYNAAYTESGTAITSAGSKSAAGWRSRFVSPRRPVFLPPELRDEMVDASLEIFRQLSTREALERSKRAVPSRFDVPGCDPLPTFAVTDFAVTREADGRLAPK